MTGQPYLKRLYEDHQAHPVPGESFWAAALRRLEVSVSYNEDALANIPRTGPLVIVANHPFGVLDGLIISYLIDKVRQDFLVLTNAVLYQADEIKAHLLPIDFAETKEALSTNLKSRSEAKEHLMTRRLPDHFSGGRSLDRRANHGAVMRPTWNGRISPRG